MSKSDANCEHNAKHKQNDNSPLPCRGCTESCPNKLYCNGKPWRQAVKKPQPDTN